MDSHAFFKYVLSSLDDSVVAVPLNFLGHNLIIPFYKVFMVPFSGPFFVLVFAPVFILVCLRHNVSNLIKTLVLVEVVLLGLSFGFVVLSIFLVSTFGHIFALFVLALAGCESALGLSLLILFFRNRGMGQLLNSCQR